MAVSTAELFHEATKYTPEALRLRLGSLEFQDRPPPFKVYPGLERITLPEPTRASLPGAISGATPSLDELARTLFLGNGVTAVARVPGEEDTELLRLRAAPSAGGMYPIELYLAVGPGGDLDPGLYAYDASGPALTVLQTGDPMAALSGLTAVEGGLRGATAAIIVTGMFERSAVRYDDRAYRRILLDCGHVIGNLTLALRVIGRPATVIPGFLDEGLSRLLLLDHHVEGGLALVPLFPADATAPRLDPRKTRLRSGILSEPGNTSIMRRLHRSSSLKPPLRSEPAAELSAFDREALRPDWSGPSHVLQAEPVPVEELTLEIPSRRSSRGFLRREIGQDELSRILRSGFTAPGLISPELQKTFVLVHRVRALEPGVYRLAATRQGELELRREPVEISPSRAAMLCLGQTLPEGAAAVVVHCASLTESTLRHGDRAYRYLHMDAGIVGESLNLAAPALGLGASGIGGFYDDMLCEDLGLSPDHIVLYLTAIGPARSDAEADGEDDADAEPDTDVEADDTNPDADRDTNPDADRDA